MATDNVRKMRGKTLLRGIIKRQEVVEYDDFYMNDLKSQLSIYELLEFTFDLFDKDIIENKASDKIILKYLNAIEILIGEYNSRGIQLKDGMHERFDAIKPKLEEMLINDGRELTKEMDAYLERTKKWVIGIGLTYPSEDNKEIIEELIKKAEETEEEVEVDNSKIEELENKVSSLQEELNENKKELSNNSKQIRKQESKIENLTKELEAKKEELKTIKTEQKETVKELNKNEKNRIKLETELEEMPIIKSEIETLRKDKEEAENTIDSQNKELIELRKIKETYESNKFIENKIISILSEKNCSAEEIFEELKKMGIKLSTRDLLTSLNNVKNRIYLSTPILKNNSPVYVLGAKSVDTNRQLTIPAASDGIVDVLVISDLHMAKCTDRIIKLYDNLYEYATKNNIGLILNLGDQYSYDHLTGTSRSERIFYNEEVIQDSIDNMPYDKNIHQAILGGNHDRRMLGYGIDPIERLTEGRLDMIYLGYDHAKVSFGSDSLMLHHLNYRLDESKGIANSLTGLKNKLNEYYDLSKINNNDIYANLFGHFHKSAISEDDGLILVPSLTNDRFQDGCYHFRIKFDSIGKIENIEIISLTNKFNSEISQTNEYLYKRR